MEDTILKEIIEDINNFEDFQKLEIVKLIDNNNIKHTRNKNGIFLNMRLLNEQQIGEIKKIINYIKNIDKIDLK